ncbi:MULTISPECIES: hypothetical protein [unclassified Halomonas]|uniref:hypothetical protein n=1 Tax=unclassified Halomonas TaxID=2609666 RepID=UPI0009906F0A|nr:MULTISPECIES: hypothetical protein [unclassified Halomonas]AQU83599.1 hypothetical protein B2G49_14085 [Halomonas sp. 'Soap Lake \
MTPEVIRRQYLDAMGITAWASRYELPNALSTQACEWEDAPAPQPPRERLHALLDDAPAPPRPRSQKSPTEPSPQMPSGVASPLAVRALLGQEAPVVAPATEAPVKPEPSSAPTQPIQPHNFSFSCVCIGGRWLAMCEGELAPAEQLLLGNMLRAAGVLNGELPAVTYFKWPPMAAVFTPEEPLEEAQEGVAAFIAGAASRQGWQLERVLWWCVDSVSDDSPLAQVMAVSQERSQTLALPVWQGPTLAALIQSANEKRALWPRLVSLGNQWRNTAQQNSD